jgi:hypothetical protein
MLSYNATTKEIVTSVTNAINTAQTLGNVATVDAINGNDSLASVGGYSYLTVAAAIGAIGSGQTVNIMPGTYTLTSGITLPSGTSTNPITIRGLTSKNVILQMNVTSSTTMFTMGEYLLLRDLTINLTCTGSTAGVVLKGIVFGGSTTRTSSLERCTINITNSSMAYTLTNTVTGIEANGTGSLTNDTFTFNAIKSTTVNIYSNGAGNKRGILVSNTNQISTRDTNVYVAQPADTASTGSYVGIETADSANTGAIQLRATSIGTVISTIGQFYTSSDILQTYPTTITNPTYLASAGIQLGPGTDLVTKTAGGKPFSAYVYPTIIYYGLKGNIKDATSGGWLWPGTQKISNDFPDTTTPAAYFSVQQPALIAGLSAGLNTSAGTTNTATLTIYVTPSGTSTPLITPLTITFGSSDTSKTFYNNTYTVNTGDRINLKILYTGGNANTATDLTAQIDLF